MNYALVLKILSLIGAIVAAAFALSFGVSALHSANPIEAEAHVGWITCLAVALSVSLILYLPSRGAQTRLFKKEAMCAVGLGWLMCSLLGALPYALIGGADFADAFFESASGFTATGASVFANLEKMPESLLFWRSLTQWIGGLGVVVFFVALLSSLGAGAKVLAAKETNLDYPDLERGKLRSGVWRIMRVYLVLSFLCALAYRVCGMSVFDAICHMFATVSTGGFSTHSAGIAEFSNASVEWVCIVFMFLGGTSFALILRAMRGDVKSLWANTEFKAYLFVIALFSLIIFMTTADFRQFAAVGIFNAFTDSVFQVVSLFTSTGFASEDYQMWPSFTHILIFIMLICGGCSGSTSGGLKIFRAVAVLKIGISDIEKSFRPNLVNTLRMNGRAVSESGLRAILSFVILYLTVALAGIFLLAAFEQNLSFGACVSGVVSAISNIGPGLDEVGPTRNFGFMTDMSKVLLGFLMIIGRLEFYAILVLFMPSLWKKYS